MYESEREVVEALRATPETLAQLLAGVPQERARAARGGDEDWSVIEVVCHLRDTEEVVMQRMRTLRDADEPLIAGFDQEALVHERNYAATDLQDALAGFIHWRTQHAADLAALPITEWDRTGTHTEIGPVSIRSHSLHIVWHDAIHLAQIARQLS